MPTIQASVLVRASTAVNVLESGDGFTVGVITHAVAARAGAAKAMAAPAAGRASAARPATRRPRRPARFRLSSRVMVFTCGNPFPCGAVPGAWSARAQIARGADAAPAQTRADAVVGGELAGCRPRAPAPAPPKSAAATTRQT